MSFQSSLQSHPLWVTLCKASSNLCIFTANQDLRCGILRIFNCFHIVIITEAIIAHNFARATEFRLETLSEKNKTLGYEDNV